MSKSIGLLALAGLSTLALPGTTPARAQGFGYAPGVAVYSGYQSVTSTSVVVAPPPVVVQQPVIVQQPVVVPPPYYGGHHHYRGYRPYGGYVGGYGGYRPRPW